MSLEWKSKGWQLVANACLQMPGQGIWDPSKTSVITDSNSGCPMSLHLGQAVGCGHSQGKEQHRAPTACSRTLLPYVSHHNLLEGLQASKCGALQILTEDME